MKRGFILLVLLSAMLVLSLALVSCRKQESGLDEFDQLLLSTSEGEMSGEAFASAIYVVIPRDSGVELSADAKALADSIADKTGIGTFLKYDSEPTVDGTFEILVGYTSRLISKENTEPLRDGDYICRYDRGSIVLGGKSESATIAAIQKFTSDILPGASYAALMSEDAHFEVYGEYETDVMTLNGYPIYEYTVVYCRESYEIADLVCKYLNNSSGYTLSAELSERYAPERSKCICLLLDASRGNAAKISATGGNIVISAPDLYGLSLAAASFVSDTCQSASGATFEGSVALNYSKSSIGLAFGFVDHVGALDIGLLAGLGETIRKTESSIICFYPVKNSLIDDIRLNCPTSRSFFAVDVGNGLSLPVLYNTADFSSVSAEQRDGSVWVSAVASDKKSWRIRIDDRSGENITYHGDEILLLSGTSLGDGSIDVISRVTYGTTSNKIENLIYSESVECTSSKTVGRYSRQESYYGMLSTELVEKYHESYIALQNALK